MTEVQYRPQKLNIWNHDDARKNVVKSLRQQCAGTGMIKAFPTKVTLEECEKLTLLLYQPERQQPVCFIIWPHNDFIKKIAKCYLS